MLMFHANNSLSNTVWIFNLGAESVIELTLLLFLCRAVCVCVCVCVCVRTHAHTYSCDFCCIYIVLFIINHSADEVVC